VIPKTHHQNFSLQFEVYLLESKLGLSSTMDMIQAVFPLSPSFDSSRITSNWRLKIWWWVQIINFFAKALKSLDFRSPIFLVKIYKKFTKKWAVNTSEKSFREIRTSDRKVIEFLHRFAQLINILSFWFVFRARFAKHNSFEISGLGSNPDKKTQFKIFQFSISESTLRKKWKIYRERVLSGFVDHFRIQCGVNNYYFGIYFDAFCVFFSCWCIDGFRKNIMR
jgi:hypothetical protein